eukprot:TRINITY_DN2615_c0_g1_i2.p1 TRINITY_DN2615_c0_g1~~TRINITY_DN2615_c0_g1_i2.p1  ORF type:complete len:148 (+),score=28.47 TRINITY_DN2615_c0_g1_i2:492-935(+)
MMYHAWTFPEIKFDMDVVASTDVWMGVFDAQGITPVHLNLVDGGVPFEGVEKRNVVIHHGAFSPENAQFQMDDKASVCSFFSLAVHESPQIIRKVVAYHILPRYEINADEISAVVSKANNLSELVTGLSTIDYMTNVAKKLSTILTS